RPAHAAAGHQGAHLADRVLSAPAHAPRPLRGQAMGAVRRGDRRMTGTTLFDKVWEQPVVADLGDDYALLHVDRHLLHDIALTMRRDGEIGRFQAADRAKRPWIYAVEGL